MIKPRINFKNGQWRCHDNFWIWGLGETPAEAYHDWKSRETRRTRIPRRGYWNIRSCMDWYRSGCPAIRSYIGCQQIVGYDFTTDELVLRG